MPNLHPLPNDPIGWARHAGELAAQARAAVAPDSWVYRSAAREAWRRALSARRVRIALAAAA